MRKANSLKYSKNKSESKWIGFLFVLPWLIGLICFKAGPLLMSFILSFMSYNIVSSPRFIGFQNFVEMAADPDFLNSLAVSFKYVLLTAPTRLIFSLFIAYLLAQNVVGIGLFRAVYYIPSLMGGNVAIAILWRYMFSENGLINNLLALVGIQGKAWLVGDFSALCVVSLLHVWQFGATMVIFLAAFKGVPSSIIEAATIDGASRWRIFISVQLPYITPVIFFNTMTNLVNAFQEFNSPFVITNGGPSQATTLLSLLIYNNAFSYLKMGYSGALSVVLFAIIVFVTLLLFSSSKYWVNYQD